MHQLAARYAHLSAHAEAGKLCAPARALSVAAREVDEVAMTAAQQELIATRRQGEWVVLHPVTAATALLQPDPRQLRDDVHATIGTDRRSAADQALAATRQSHPHAWPVTTPTPGRPTQNGWRSPHRRSLSGPEL